MNIENVCLATYSALKKKRSFLNNICPEKYSSSFNKLHSKSYKLITQEIIMHKYRSLFTKILENIYKSNVGYENNDNNQSNFNNNFQ